MEDLAKLLTKLTILTMDLVKNLSNTTKRIETLEKENFELKTRIHNIEQIINQINNPKIINFY